MVIQVDMDSDFITQIRDFFNLNVNIGLGDYQISFTLIGNHHLQSSEHLVLEKQFYVFFDGQVFCSCTLFKNLQYYASFLCVFHFLNNPLNLLIQNILESKYLGMKAGIYCVLKTSSIDELSLACLNSQTDS